MTASLPSNNSHSKIYTETQKLYTNPTKAIGKLYQTNSSFFFRLSVNEDGVLVERFRFFAWIDSFSQDWQEKVETATRELINVARDNSTGKPGETTNKNQATDKTQKLNERITILAQSVGISLGTTQPSQPSLSANLNVTNNNPKITDPPIENKTPTDPSKIKAPVLTNIPIENNVAAESSKATDGKRPSNNQEEDVAENPNDHAHENPDPTHQEPKNSQPNEATTLHTEKTEDVVLSVNQNENLDKQKSPTPKESFEKINKAIIDGKWGSLESIIVQMGKDIHAVDENGNNILHYLFKNFNISVIDALEILTEKGVNVFQVNKDNKMPIIEGLIPEKLKNDDVFNEILPLLTNDSQKKNLEQLTEEQVSKLCELATKTLDQNSSKRLLDELGINNQNQNLDKQPSPTAKESFEKIDKAISDGNDIQSIIEQMGKDIHKVDENGNNILHYLFENFNLSYLEALDLLTEKGVNVFQVNEDKKMPIIEGLKAETLNNNYLFDDVLKSLMKAAEKHKASLTETQINTLREKAPTLGEAHATTLLNALDIKIEVVPVTLASLSEVQSLDDGRFKNLKLRAHTLKPLDLPEISLDQDVYTKQLEKVKELEKSLKAKYNNELTALTWHGHSSFQRIIWQDEDFLKAIQDPLTVKTILKAQKDNKLTIIENSARANLATFLLFGLKSNNFSYLASAAPNMRKIPQQGSWKNLRQMKAAQDAGKKETSPYIPQEANVRNLNKALTTIQNVLEELNISEKEDMKSKEKFKSTLGDMSPSQLITLFDQFISDDKKARQLVSGYVGSSTELKNMYLQSLEVMDQYKALLQENGNNHAHVLGYGLVSHALDARHLAADLYYLAHPLENKPTGYSEAGQNALESLINDFKTGKLDADTEKLLSFRIQQVITLIIDQCENYGITTDMLPELGVKSQLLPLVVENNKSLFRREDFSSGKERYNFIADIRYATKKEHQDRLGTYYADAFENLKDTADDAPLIMVSLDTNREFQGGANGGALTLKAALFRDAIERKGFKIEASFTNDDPAFWFIQASDRAAILNAFEEIAQRPFIEDLFERLEAKESVTINSWGISPHENKRTFTLNADVLTITGLECAKVVEAAILEQWPDKVITINDQQVSPEIEHT